MAAAVVPVAEAPLVLVTRPKPQASRPLGRPTPEKENGPAHVLRAAANAAVLRRGAIAHAEVNAPPVRPGQAGRMGLRPAARA